MKNYRIFAENTPSSSYKHEKAVAIFMFGLLLSAKIWGYRFHNGLLHLCCNLNLAVRGAVAFLILITLIFCHMPSSTKNASKENNSNLISTDSHETALFLISELNKLSSSLPTKLSININIIIGNNNIVNSGIVCGGMTINPQNITL